MVPQLLAAGLLALGLLLPAHADQPTASVDTTPAPLVEAHPAIWTAHGKHATIYLLGSIHILAPNIHWRTAEIGNAIDAADIFVFEIPTDASSMASVTNLINERGTLPPGQSLRAILSPESQGDYDKAVAFAGIPPAAIDNRRPWLAGLVIGLSQMMKKTGASPEAGLDKMITSEATDRRKEMRYLETAEQQLDLIAPKDQKLELQEFESGLKEFLKSNSEKDTDDLIEAWESGDPTRMDAIFNESMEKYPKLRKVFLDDRNRNWVTVIRRWLDSEDKTFLVTVGAGHLVGKTGVPNLLRQAGYKVDGP